MKLTLEQIDHMPVGPEINALIEAEIFGAIPLTDEEWELCRATVIMAQGPHSAAHSVRLLKFPLDEPQYETGLMFRLQWPSDYTSDIFGSSSRLINQMRADGWLFSLYEVPGSGDATLCIAAFEKMPHFNMRGCQGKAEAPTDALAISRAALKAKLMESKAHV